MACWKWWWVYDKVENGPWSDDVASDIINMINPILSYVRPWTLGWSDVQMIRWSDDQMIRWSSQPSQPYPLLRPTLKIPMLWYVYTVSYTVLASNDSVVWFDLGPWEYLILWHTASARAWHVVKVCDQTGRGQAGLDFSCDVRDILRKDIYIGSTRQSNKLKVPLLFTIKTITNVFLNWL